MHDPLVVQSVYGDYDSLEPWCEQSVPYRRTFVSAQHVDMDKYGLEGSSAHPRPHMHPRFAAKVAKCLPHRFGKADTIIWVDGSIVPTDAWFVEYLLTHSQGPISQFDHPLRRHGSVLDEAEASAWMAKYKGQPVIDQATAYLDNGLGRDFGIWATGVIVYRAIGGWDWLERFGTSWLMEQMWWTYQDQISEPWCLWKAGLAPHTIPGNLFAPPHFVIRNHASDL